MEELWVAGDIVRKSCGWKSDCERTMPKQHISSADGLSCLDSPISWTGFVRLQDTDAVEKRWFS